MPGAFGTADEVTLKAAAAAEPGTDGVDLVAEVTTRRALHGRRPAPTAAVVAYDFGIKTHDPAPPRRARPRSRSCPAATPAADVLARRARRRVPLQRPRRPRRRALRGRHHPRPARRGAGLRHLPRPPAAGHRPRRPTRTSCPFGHHGGNHPVRRLADRRGRDHQPEPQLRRRPTGSVAGAEVTHVNLNDGVVEGLRAADAAGLQRAVPPRGRARAPTTPATCSTSSPS